MSNLHVCSCTCLKPRLSLKNGLCSLCDRQHHWDMACLMNSLRTSRDKSDCGYENENGASKYLNRIFAEKQAPAYRVCTWCNYIAVPKQWNGSHVSVPNLGNPGAARRDHAIFSGESLLQCFWSKLLTKYCIIPSSSPWVSEDGGSSTLLFQ